MMDKGVFRQGLAAFIGSLSVMVAGTSYGWITPLLAKFHNENEDLSVVINQLSFLFLLLELSSLIISIPAGILTDVWGRKPLLLITAPIYIFSWLMVLTTRSVVVLYFVCIIQGLAMGVVHTVLPLYLAEISSPGIRGAISMFFEGMWYMGIPLGYILTPYLSYFSFNTVFIMLPVVFLITFIWIPESPYFLLANNHKENAVASLKWLRITTVIKEELNVIDNCLRPTSTQAAVKGILIVELIAVTKFMSGISAILLSLSYSSYMLISIGSFGIIMGTLILVSIVFAGSLVDVVERRPLLIISCTGCGVSQFIVGLYCFMEETPIFYISINSIVYMTSVMIYCISFSLGLGPLVNTFKGELFPTSIKGFGSGLATMTGTISCFICIKIYHFISHSYGVCFNFWIFSIINFIGAVLVYYIVPETKGKTLTEIQQSLNSTCDHKESDKMFYKDIKFY